MGGKYEGTIALAKYEAKMRRKVTIAVTSQEMLDYIQKEFDADEKKLIEFQLIKPKTELR